MHKHLKSMTVQFTKYSLLYCICNIAFLKENVSPTMIQKMSEYIYIEPYRSFLGINGKCDEKIKAESALIDFFCNLMAKSIPSKYEAIRNRVKGGIPYQVLW